MSEHPILFNGEMVRAILDGRKTQTRRVIKTQPEGLMDTSVPMRKDTDGKWVYSHPVPDPLVPDYISPYGGPGDQLWVRENFGVFDIDKAILDRTPLWDGLTEVDELVGMTQEQKEYAFLDNKMRLKERYELLYQADGDKGLIGWRPSIHMPRWAARALLDVLSIRVERLQDISEEDAKAEGLFKKTVESSWQKNVFWCISPNPIADKEGLFPCWMDPRKTFENLWDSINAKRGFGWDTNPWVFVVEWPKVRT